MPRRQCLFKKRDVKRAVEAVMAAGLIVAGVEYDKDGIVRVVPGKPTEPQQNELPNDWDNIQ
jgi:hypothetical protein